MPKHYCELCYLYGTFYLLMTTRFNRNLSLGSGLSIFILLLVTFISYLTLQSLLNSNRRVEHSARVIEKLESVLSVMKDAETGQRGYLLSGKATYLEPYNGAYQLAIETTDSLRKLTADNSDQQRNIDTIQKVLSQRFTILKSLVDKMQRGGQIFSRDLDEGKAAMDDLRAAVARAEGLERVLQKERTGALQRYTALAPLLILLAALTAVAVAIFTYRTVAADYKEKVSLQTGLEQRERETQNLNEELTAANEEITAANEELTSINEELMDAREELALANDSLEKRVIERTQALQNSEEETQALNEELTAINEEMAATNEELQTTIEELAENEQRLQSMVDELKQSDERSAKLVAIVESSDDAIIGKSLEGIITSWNRGAEVIFGYNEADIVGQSVLLLIPEDLHHEEPQILERLSKGEKIDHYETTRRTKDGGLITVSLTISPIINKEGKVTGVSKIARDITEQKQDEQRKNDFIGMASHELKTPLTSLTALIQVLQMKLKNGNDPFVSQALTKANLQTKKMINLINGFLNVSRLESGKLEIVRTTFSLNDLLAEQLDEIKLTVSSHDFHFEPTGDIKISADHDKLGSVISNLLSNAVKYSPKGKNVYIYCSVENSEVITSVRDEGMGIRAQDLSKIFDRYFRAGSEHTRHISGFGVGLYLSAEIVDRHGGRIWVESEKAAGSTFYFALPVELSGSKDLHI